MIVIKVRFLEAPLSQHRVQRGEVGVGRAEDRHEMPGKQLQAGLGSQQRPTPENPWHDRPAVPGKAGQGNLLRSTH
jgi:hypothetical protein